VPLDETGADQVVVENHIEVFQSLGFIALQVIPVDHVAFTAEQDFYGDFPIFLRQNSEGLPILDEVEVAGIRDEKVGFVDPISDLNLDLLRGDGLILLVQDAPVDYFYVVLREVSGIEVFVDSWVAFLGDGNEQDQKQYEGHADFDIEIPAF
jgi:hypothetical protein